MFSAFLLEHGFSASKSDSSLFFLHQWDDVTLILVYVDDRIFTGSNAAFIEDFIALLGQKFKMKDFGLLNFFLGLK